MVLGRRRRTAEEREAEPLSLDELIDAGNDIVDRAQLILDRLTELKQDRERERSESGE